MTDRSASRLAWATFAFVALLLLAVLVSSWLNVAGRDASAWDSSHAIATDLFAIAMFSFPAVGVLIAGRHPRNPIGWILLATGLTWQTAVLTGNYIEYGVVTHPGSVPEPELVAALSSWLWVPGIGLVGTFLILLFPDGRLPSPRWRPLAWISALTMVVASLAIVIKPGPLTESGFPDLTNPLGIQSLRLIWPAAYVFVALIPVCIIGCAASVTQRFRRSRGLERLQLKWLAAGAGISAIVYLVAVIVSIPYDWVSPSNPLFVRIIQNVAPYSFVLIPAAAGIAILKHRLYDIDLFINRTLVYGALTASLAAVYFAGVVGLGGVLRSLSGQPSGNLAVAGSTLAVAALFRPLRSRIQTLIDRRFYRRKYDAAKAVQEFSATMRAQTDLDALNAELLAVVSDALQPAHVMLWIRPTEDRPPRS
jgi:hypothetical protein